MDICHTNFSNKFSTETTLVPYAITVTIYQAQNNKISLSQTNSNKTMIPKFDSANDCNGSNQGQRTIN